MYKSVSFNIFEENLEEIVYGEIPVSHTKIKDANEKTVVVIGEITVPKIADKNADDFTYGRFGWNFEGTSNTL